MEDTMTVAGAINNAVDAVLRLKKMEVDILQAHEDLEKAVLADNAGIDVGTSIEDLEAELNIMLTKVEAL
jgi:hypothetical protein